MTGLGDGLNSRLRSSVNRSKACQPGLLLQRDLAAVINGLTLPWSSGAVEGHVNRVKMLKRQMYGRAKFDLLRRRILQPN